MKILLVTSSFPRWDADFAGVFLQKLVTELHKLGNEVIVLTPHAKGTRTHEREKGITIVRFRYAWPESLETLAYGQGILYNLRENPFRAFLIPSFVFFLGCNMRRLRARADIVNTHWIIPQGLVAAMFRIRSVITLHGSDVHLRVPVFGKWLLRFALSWAISITSNSRGTLRQIQGMAPEVPRNIIPMGVDIGAYARDTVERDNTRTTLRIACVGRLIPWKGQRYLIEAIPSIKAMIGRVHVNLVGDGPERNALEELAKRLSVSDSVTFLGTKESSEIPRILWDHDIFVLPSIILPSGETEGLGTVLLEAMAAGVPVIGSAVGGIPDIITDGRNGLLVPPGSPEAIARAVARIATDDRLRGRLTQSARRDVEGRFSWEGIGKQFEKLFRDVIRQ
jgi:glycosyltransferase involved in cell wall biosynthesis